VSAIHNTLSREVTAIQIPSGEKVVLPAGSPFYVTQSLGGTHTIEAPGFGGLFRIAGADADALGLEAARGAVSEKKGSADGPFEEKLVWDQLRACYDPEIPVNIVDLGLVYDLAVSENSSGGARVVVKMTLTAPGCGMGTAIADDARHRILTVSGVSEADVQLVWDPPWSAEMMSPAGKKQLGIA
jgi:probable FeS assembly SUF system protein SufT